ncbi:hypothetical protein [Proteus mirabilis]|uniref:hypothetical protein n=1 Tax=Proteus mirabilis TaxID=584 RepID=UPI0035C79846
MKIRIKAKTLKYNTNIVLPYTFNSPNICFISLMAFFKFINIKNKKIPTKAPTKKTIVNSNNIISP